MSFPIYQQMMIEHLLTHKRAALFCGLGLRKTASTLQAFLGLRALGLAETMLVVAPLRVCNLTWPNEVAKWKMSLRVCNLRQGVCPADVYLCNYEMLPKLGVFILTQKPDVVVFDEITRAKNHRSKRIKAIRDLIPDKTRIWGLTGTPAPNSMLELFGQFKLLDGGERLGRSFDLFKRTYFHAMDYMEYDWQLLPGAKEKIQERIKDITLTLLSSEYADVPDTVVEDLEVGLPDETRAQYKKLERDLLISIGKDAQVVVAVNAAVLVNKLLQLTSGVVYDENKQTVQVHHGKLDALLKYVDKYHEPALIVYNYRHELELLRKMLPEAVAFEDAKTPKAQGELEARWNAGKVRQLLVHPASVGHGLNLQEGGSTVIWFSLTWSRELYDQLNGRVARQGQKQLIKIVRIICPGTIDDAVVETLREKGEGQTALLTALTNLRKMQT